MPTKLTGEKQVIRETAAQYRRRTLVFKATSHIFVMWEKGRKGEAKFFEIDYLSIYEAAMRKKALERLPRKARRSR